MIFGHSREEFRRSFFNAYRKYQNNEVLEPLEKQIVDIILEHPEYHFIFDTDDNQFHDVWENQRTENPFLHMALHLSIRDQVSLDQPTGITEMYQSIVKQEGSVSQAEHKMIPIIFQTIQDMLKENKAFESHAYLSKLRALLHEA